MAIYFWYDNLSKEFLEGKLQKLSEQGITGVTSNPTIFQLAVSKSSIYDETIRKSHHLQPENICWDLMVEDVKQACKIFKNIFEKTNRETGFVSLELHPSFANDVQSSVMQAEELHARVSEPNLMIKVPATTAGLQVISELIHKGINVNVTLIFSCNQYQRVINAYMKGLEMRQKDGLPLDTVSSVASFFVSRVDSKVDKLPDENVRRKFFHKMATLNSHLAYLIYMQAFSSQRFLKLSGARPQKLLWASTGVKDPSRDPLFYVKNLNFDNVVFTLPDSALNAYLENRSLPVQQPKQLTEIVSEIHQFNSYGYFFEELLAELLDEGVQLFQNSFTQLVETVKTKLE